jgi:hypothetical protein
MCLALLGFHLTSDSLTCATLLVVQQNIDIKLNLLSLRIVHHVLLCRPKAFRAIANYLWFVGPFYVALSVSGYIELNGSMTDGL